MMECGQGLVLIVVGLVSHLYISPSFATCPWEQDGLSPWSEPGSWPSGEVPGEDDAVVIPKGMSILLDTDPPRLESLTIKDGGMLVWGNVDNVTIETNYIRIDGEMHIGAEACRFEKEANIFLYGKTDSTFNVEGFGRKFIGVAEGGTLEVHGKDKASWSKLTGTVGLQKDCHNIYDSRDEALGKERGEGIFITVWNTDGSEFDATFFATEHPDGGANEQLGFAKYVQELPSGYVVAMAVYADIGNVHADQEWESVYSTIEGLGGAAIRSLRSKEPYAFVAVIGDPTSKPVERLVTRGAGMSEDTLEAVSRLSRMDANGNHVTFAASSIVTPGTTPNEARFKVTPYDVAFPVLTLVDDVSTWQPGDQIVVASTDYKWEQAEVKTIVECQSYCTTNQVRVEGEFEYSHFGEVTYGVDERAEVGLLTRNIKVEGSVEDDCYGNNDRENLLCERLGRDTFGGHIKVLRGHKSVHMEGVELYHMGQQAFLGSYPLHFHMCDDVTGMWLRHNSIHHTFARCVTIHGTDGLEVSDNVCYKHLGHGFFLEDSVEQNNTLHRNLGIGTEFGHLIMTDMKPDWCGSDLRKSCGQLSTFWLTHGNNIVTDNVAAGSNRFGFMYAFSDVPLGPSYQRQLERQLVANFSTRYTRIKEFSGNTAHSNHDTGLNIEGLISHGVQEGVRYIPENGIMQHTPGQYSAREPPTEDGQKVDTVLDRLTFYKNEETDAWVRGGNIVISRSSFADSRIGFISAHNAGDSSCDVRDSLFIGQTDNKGEGFVYRNRTGIYHGKHWSDVPTHTFDRSIGDYQPGWLDGSITLDHIPIVTEDFVSGIAFYQGPMFVDNCYFDRYFNWFYNDTFEDVWGYRPVRPGAAISFHRSSGYYSQVNSGVSNLKFGFCDDTDDRHYLIAGNGTFRGWTHQDGSITQTVRDYDGSLTGRPNTQIVRDNPFFIGPKCLKMSEWGMTACPYHYAAVSIIGDDGVLSATLKRAWPTLINRDDEPEDVVKLAGQTSNMWTLRANMSYTIRFNHTLGDVPTSMRLKGFDLDSGEVVRLALCLPKDTTEFYISGVGPIINRRNPAVLVDSVEDLDADDSGRAYYWDKEQGLLYVKLVGQGERTSPDELCPGEDCTVLYIKRLDGGKGPALCKDAVIPSYTGVTEDPDQVGVKSCHGIDYPMDVGAMTPQELSEAQWPAPGVVCPIPAPEPHREPIEYRGCFEQRHRNPDLGYAYIKMYGSMTPQLCADRCFRRGFPYSAVHQSYRCECGYTFGRTGPLSDDECEATTCPGDKSQYCGGSARLLIHATGASLPPAPQPCGPGLRGVIYKDTCIYLNMIEEDWRYARRRCLEMGGDLAKIDSEGKQNAINEYMAGLTYEVWAGLVWEDSQWKYLDGTPIGNYSNWWSEEISAPSSNYLYYLRLVPKYNSKWFNHRNHDNNMALCDLPIVEQPMEKHSCGYNQEGFKKGGDGPCLALVHKASKLINAQFQCNHMMGTLAPVDTEDNKRAVESFLMEYGAPLDYWVESGTSKGQAYDFKGNERHILTNFGSSAEISFVCRLDEIYNIMNCPTGWSYFQGKCYLSRGVKANTMQLVSAYCNSGSSQVVTINSLEENDFVASLVPGQFIWLGLEYKSSHDKHVWVDNLDRYYTNWYYGNPLTYLSKGRCVALHPSSKLWRNKECHSGSAYVVCERPSY